MPSTAFHPRRRGLAARRALLAIASECERRRVPFPPYEALTQLLGISPSQISRHWAMILDAGPYTTRQQGRRIYVERAVA